MRRRAELKTSPQKILILGGAGWTNVGDDLIAEALKEWVASADVQVRVAGGPYAHDNAEKGLSLAGNFRSRVRLAWEIYRSDYVLIGGGGLLDDRTRQFYRPFTRAALLCRTVGTPYAFAGIGVGPIQNDESREAYRTAAEGAHRVFVRDETSRDRLVASGVTRPIDVTPDPVLWGAAPLARTGKGFDLAINLRNWHTAKNPKAGYEGPSDSEIIESVATAVNAVFDSGSKVALVSMSGQPGDDDSAALSKLRPLLKAETETFFDCAPAEVQRAIGASSTVLAMRLHACLLGAKMGSKVLGLAYDPKVAQQGERVGFNAIALDRHFGSSGAGRMSQILSSSQDSRYNYLPAPKLPWAVRQ